MAKDYGWVKIHRSSFNNRLYFSEPFTRWQAWVDLILMANHQEGVIRKRGVSVIVERGQVGCSEVTLSERWKWSRGKVRRFLKELKSVHQIEHQKTNVTTLITILNYEEYQNIEQHTGHQTDTKRYSNNNRDISLVKQNPQNEKKESIRGLSAGEALYVGRYGNSLPEVVGNKKDDSGSKGNG